MLFKAKKKTKQKNLGEEITVPDVAPRTTSHLAGPLQVLPRLWVPEFRAAQRPGTHLPAEAKETQVVSWKAAGTLLVESNQGFGKSLSKLDRLPLVGFDNLPFYYLKRNFSFFLLCLTRSYRIG